MAKRTRSLLARGNKLVCNSHVIFRGSDRDALPPSLAVLGGAPVSRCRSGTFLREDHYPTERGPCQPDAAGMANMAVFPVSRHGQRNGSRAPNLPGSSHLCIGVEGATPGTSPARVATGEHRKPAPAVRRRRSVCRGCGNRCRRDQSSGTLIRTVSAAPIGLPSCVRISSFTGNPVSFSTSRECSSPG